MKLTSSDITARLGQRPGWAYESDRLVRQFTFSGFPDAIAFVARLAFDAEANDHHPDLTINYKRVRVEWSTHSEGGVTEKDFAGAAAADAAAARFGG
ncbi:MAG: 4a-hydroxytetrahydrobiopterin dehydratase [Vicinamibacterales bacterium]